MGRTLLSMPLWLTLSIAHTRRVPGSKLRYLLISRYYESGVQTFVCRSFLFAWYVTNHGLLWSVQVADYKHESYHAPTYMHAKQYNHICTSKCLTSCSFSILQKRAWYVAIPLGSFYMANPLGNWYMANPLGNWYIVNPLGSWYMAI